MSVSIKSPTATTGSIQLNGSDVLTIDSSGNLTAPNNLTASGNLSVTGTVTQTGNATFNGTVGINGATNNRAQLEVKAGNSTIHQLFLEQNNTEHGWQLYADQADGGLAFFRRDNSGQTERMRITTDGNVLIGKASTNYNTLGISFTPNNSCNLATNGTQGNFKLSSPVSQSQIAFYRQDTGALMGYIINGASNTVSYATSSDYRLKDNVSPMSGSIDRLKQLKPSTWSWKIDGSHGEGFLAHEAQAVVPEAIHGTKDAVDDEGNPVYQGIDQSKLVPLLTAALQEAITKIENLETRIQALETQNTSLITRIEALENA